MKTDRLSNQSIAPHKHRHPDPMEKKETRVKENAEAQERFEIARQLNNLREQRQRDNQEAKQALADMLDRNVEWHDLRFYRHKKDGNDYVDIIDRVSGEVLKTIPEPDFVKLANHFKQHPGITLDITS